MAIQSLDRSELLALLRQAKKMRHRDWLMIVLAFNHGLRVTEIVGGWLTRRAKHSDSKKVVKIWYAGLTPGSFTETHIIIPRIKGSLKTTQPLREDAEPLLDERRAVLAFIRNKPRNQRLFQITRVRFWQIVREHGEAAGLLKHKCHPHVLKHSIAMQTIKNAGIENVRQYLGHKSIGSTGAYLRVNDEDAAAAVENSLNV